MGLFKDDDALRCKQVYVMNVTPWVITDEKTGKERRGCTIEYLSDDVRTDNFRGRKMLQASGDPVCFSQFDRPNEYNMYGREVVTKAYSKGSTESSKNLTKFHAENLELVVDE
jgi:hypothetical protein